MTKYDITQATSAADELLKQTDDPLHRQILENYRRHALLEISGRFEEILTDDMMVEDPHYLLEFSAQEHDLRGRDEIREFYSALHESGGTVMMPTDEMLRVFDGGFASQANFHHFLPGDALVEGGFDVDDPDGHYIHHSTLTGIWHYDDQGRLIGEHLGEIGGREIEKVPPEDFITPSEARERLEPLIRPLPDLPEPKEDFEKNRFYQGGVGKPVNMESDHSTVNSLDESRDS